MSIAKLEAKPSPWTEFVRGLARERALLVLFERGRSQGLTLRLARVVAFGVFTSYALAIVFTRGADRGASVRSCVHAALLTLSWGVGAPVALSAARFLAEPSGSDPLAALALGRGYARHSLFRARVLSVALRVARPVALFGVSLVGIGLARGATAIWALSAAPAVLVYASALGLVLALLALLAAELAPRRPRALLVYLVLALLLVARAFPSFPSPLAALSWLLDELLDSGAALT